MPSSAKIRRDESIRAKIPLGHLNIIIRVYFIYLNVVRFWFAEAGSSNPTMSRRGKGTKWYGIRVGRQPGVCDTWAECKARVDGISGAECRSFPTAEEAMD